MNSFRAAPLPAPRVTATEAERIARQHFDLTVTATSLGSQQDCNYLLSHRNGSVAGVLKIANPAFSALEISAQDACVEWLSEREPEIRLPRSVGATVTVVTLDGVARARVLSFLGGGTLTGSAYLPPVIVAELGDLAGRVSCALADFTHPGLDRDLEWDPRHADAVVAQLLEHGGDVSQQDLLATAAGEAWARIESLADALPQQAVHLDLTDDNVVCSVRSGVRLPDGVIDFGDLTRSWAVAELAITISSVLHHDGAEPASVLPAVKAFHARRPLSLEEANALWPLVILRAAVLVVSGRRQAHIDVDNAYVSSSLDREWLLFERAASIPCDVMTGVICHALGLDQQGPLAFTRGEPLIPDFDPERCAVLDLSAESDAVDDGAWLEAGLVDRLAQAALAAGSTTVVTRFAEARLSESRILADTSPATIATGIDLWLADGVQFVVPDRAAPDAVELTVSGEDQPLRLTLRLAGAPMPPPFVRPEYAPGWLALLADPLSLLGVESPAPANESRLLERRAASFASVQEHYYARPPRIERGWRHHLAADDGRIYLDMVNNVAAVGHAHPRIADAVNRQLRRLNTNSRFHYASVVEFTERLTSLLPESLDTVFLVNSGSEAVDLAIRLAFASTGQRDIVAVREAYHGWTYASDAVSTSIADNPAALSTRPDWIHTVDAPNSYRGRYRGADAAEYAVDAVELIDRLAEDGRPAAGFIAEAFYGNAGGMQLPDGYLTQVYEAVRRHGGLAIADEIQVGYGRLGKWFWGFEQQGVVPDIVTIAKAMGNGHPLGAVITSREVADRYRTQGYFFSSTGGSPVSSVVGLTVLDIIRDGQLQRNAATVGAHLRQRLERLADKHELIGAVYGSGLYIGVEFVRDRMTLEPATDETMAICNRMLDLGVIIQPTSDRMCVLKIKPPLCIDEAAADFFVDMLDRVLTEGW